MVGIHILNPFLFVFTKVMPRIIGPYYRAFGVTGMLALPFMQSYEGMMALMAVWAVGGTMLGSAPTAHAINVVPPESRAQASHCISYSV